MGHTDWNYGPSDSTYRDAFARVLGNSDIICMQFNDGIPWPEAYAGEPYPKALQDIINNRKELLPEGHKVYLEIASLNMGRNDFAGYRGESGHMPMPAPWDTYAIDAEEMITAYANFCIDMIDEFDPAYVCYGLESTDLIHSQPDQWKAYARFHKGVYDRIKTEHPDVPLSISMPLKHPAGEQAKALQEGIVDLLPAIDYLAGSIYAFVFFGHENAGDPANLPEGWFQQLIEAAHGKPIAIGETNWIAEDLVVDTWDINVESNPEWQQEYLELLLDKCQEHEALHLIWWSIADFDRAWQAMPDEVKDLGKIWRDTGLLDGDLEPRPAMDTWKRYLALPVEPGRPLEKQTE
jgi:hypothetical protein